MSGQLLLLFSNADPPTPPRKLAIEDLKRTSCVLTWKEPEYDGGSDITGYYVERQQGAYLSRWTPVNRGAVNSLKLDIRVGVHLHVV